MGLRTADTRIFIQHNEGNGYGTGYFSLIIFFMSSLPTPVLKNFSRFIASLLV